MSWYDALPDPLPTDEHRWASPEFREEVAVWVGEVAAPVLAMEQVKLRPWATVWRVDTTAGAFFASNCRAQRVRGGTGGRARRVGAPPDRAGAGHGP